MRSNCSSEIRDEMGEMGEVGSLVSTFRDHLLLLLSRICDTTFIKCCRRESASASLFIKILDSVRQLDETCERTAPTGVKVPKF